MKDSPENLPEQPSEEPSRESSTPPTFDIEGLRLGQNFDALAGVRKALVTVPTRKPNRQSFVRVRPGEEWRLQTQIIELKEDREVYVVDRPLWGNLAQEVVPVTLFVATDRQGVVFVWPVKLGRTHLASIGVSRYAAYRALNALEKSGLVALVRQRGSAPIVTIRPIAVGNKPGGEPVSMPPNHVRTDSEFIEHRKAIDA